MKVLFLRQHGTRVEQIVVALRLRWPLAQGRLRDGVFWRSAAYPEVHSHQRFSIPPLQPRPWHLPPRTGQRGDI